MKSKAKKDKKLKKRLIRYIPLYIMALPGLLYLFINNYMPLPGLVLAFKKYNAKKGIFGSANVGFKNFKYLFATKDAFVITRNTILYNVVFITIGRDDFEAKEDISDYYSVAIYDFNGYCELSGVRFSIK